MAEKKDDKKGGKPGGGGGGDLLSWVVGLLIAGAVLTNVIGGLERRLGFSFREGVSIPEVTEQISQEITEGAELPESADGGFSWRRWLANFRALFLWLSAIVSTLAFVGAIIVWRRLEAAQWERREAMRLLEKKLVEESISGQNLRWEQVRAKVAGENPGDWRVAILEADIMLDEVLTRRGYHGDTLGDKLKAVEASDMATLDLAWEAHKVRNRIAHAGSDFILTHREAQRVVDLYGKVFEEFEFV